MGLQISPRNGICLLKKAKAKWVLFIDSDEEMTSGLVNEINHYSVNQLKL